MHSFSGILLVSDIDGTLLRGDNRVGKSTASAIRRFQAKGGRFTLATGRMPAAMAEFLTDIRLSAPAICFNGAAIHDFETGTTLWRRQLDPSAAAVVAHVAAEFPDSGIEVYREETIYFPRLNPLIREHMAAAGFELAETDWRDIPHPWTKALFVQSEERTGSLKRHLLASPFAARFQFVRSSDEYFELLPAGASKGAALKELCRLAGQDIGRTVAVGDNDNDVEMLKAAGLGIAVDNASDSVKAHAGHVTVHHDEEAIRQVIEDLETGRLSI